MNNVFFKLIIFIFVFIFVFENIIALGITPGRTTIDFSPNLEKSVEFSVINTEKKDFEVAFTVQGDLSDYIDIGYSSDSFSKDEYEKKFSYDISLPLELKPGLHTAEVIAVEIAKGMNSQDTIIQTTVSVATQLHVYVPYPGKYIDASLNIINREENNLISFEIPVISRGQEKINNVHAQIKVYKGSDLIETIVLNEGPLNPGERKVFSRNWEPEVRPGIYKAVVEINYDGNKLSLEKEFDLGKAELELLSIGTNDFKLGEIAKIKVLVSNQKSDIIKDSLANLKVFDENNKIADIKSENYEIPASSNKEMLLYWDTENLKKGEYTGDLRIDYDERFLSKGFKINVNDNSMKFTGIGFVVSSEESKKISVTSILVIVIGVLVLLNLIWFAIYMKNKKKK